MIVAGTMVRDEMDVLPWTLGHLAPQVDHIIVADNGSVDGTRQWLAQCLAEDDGTELTVLDDPEPGYWQARKMTRLMRLAHEMGADLFLPFDADEAWTLPPDLADRPFDVVHARPHVMVPHRTDLPVEAEPNPLRRILHRAVDPEPMPKVIVRPHRAMALQMGNHGVVWPPELGPCRTVAMPDVEVRHYQYRTLLQAERKAAQGTAAYDATTLPAGRFGSHWRDLAGLDRAGRRRWWAEHCRQPTSLVAPLDSPDPR